MNIQLKNIIHSLVQDARDEKALHLGGFNVKLVGDERDRNARIRTNEFHQNLSADVPQKICKNKSSNESGKPPKSTSSHLRCAP